MEIDKTIRAGVAGLPVSKYRDKEGKEYDIVVRLPFTGKLDYEDLDKIYVSSVRGAQIPLRQVASFEFVASPMQINHYNLERNVTVTADVLGDLSVDEVTKKHRRPIGSARLAQRISVSYWRRTGKQGRIVWRSPAGGYRCRYRYICRTCPAISILYATADCFFGDAAGDYRFAFCSA